MEADAVIKMVEEYFGVLNIGRKTRKQPWTYYRYVYFKLCEALKKENKWSLGDIGHACGERDHATAHHGIRKFDSYEKQSWFKEYRKAYYVLLNNYRLAKKRKTEREQFSSIEECERHYQLKLVFLIDKQARVRRNLFNMQAEHILDKVLELPEEFSEEFCFLAENFVERKKKEMAKLTKYQHLL